MSIGYPMIPLWNMPWVVRGMYYGVACVISNSLYSRESVSTATHTGLPAVRFVLKPTIGGVTFTANQRAWVYPRRLQSYSFVLLRCRDIHRPDGIDIFRRANNIHQTFRF